MGPPTDERNRAITQAALEAHAKYERDKGRNGSSEPQSGVHQMPARVSCGQDGCPGIAGTLTDHEVKSRPVSLGLLVAILAIAVSVVGSLLLVDGHLKEARAAVVRVHDQSAASHPDIRASQERSTKRIEGRLDAVTHALDRIREDLRQRAAEPARRRRR